MNKAYNISEHKALEIELHWLAPYTEWIVFNLSTRSHGDHKGISLTIEFLKLVYFNINFYDTRHEQ